MDRNAERLINLLNQLPVSKWGIGDVGGLHPLTEEYPRAISLLMAYAPEFEGYNEEAYHTLLTQKRFELDHIISALREFFDEHSVNYAIVPHGGQNPETLIGMFSNKLAATRAGLGWIGKNSLLITEEYGPRVRLATILVALNLPCSEPINVSQCKDCEACVEACPYGYIHGLEWYPGIDRELLFDAFACSSKREEFIKTIGRKHTCGLCLLACTRGK